MESYTLNCLIDHCRHRNSIALLLRILHLVAEMSSYSPSLAARRLLLALCLASLLLLAMWSFGQNSTPRFPTPSEYILSYISPRDVGVNGFALQNATTPGTVSSQLDTQDVKADGFYPESSTRSHELRQNNKRDLQVDGTDPEDSPRHELSSQNEKRDENTGDVFGDGSLRLGSILPKIMSGLPPEMATPLASMAMAPLSTLLPSIDVPVTALPTLVGDGGGAGVPIVPAQTVATDIAPIPTAAPLGLLGAGLTNMFSPLDSIVPQVPSLVDKLLGVATSAVAQIADTAQNAAAEVAQIGNNIAEQGLNPDDALLNAGDVLSSVHSNVAGIVNDVGSIASDVLSAVPTDILDGDLVEGIKNLVDAGLNSIVADPNGPLKQVGDIVHKVLCIAEEVVDGIIYTRTGICGDMASASVSIPQTTSPAVTPTEGGGGQPTSGPPGPTTSPVVSIPNSTPGAGGALPSANPNSNGNGQTPPASNPNAASPAPGGSGLPGGGGSGGSRVSPSAIPTSAPSGGSLPPANGGSISLVTIPSETPGASVPMPTVAPTSGSLGGPNGAGVGGPKLLLQH